MCYYTEKLPQLCLHFSIVRGSWRTGNFPPSILRPPCLRFRRQGINLKIWGIHNRRVRLPVLGMSSFLRALVYATSRLGLYKVRSKLGLSGLVGLHLHHVCMQSIGTSNSHQFNVLSSDFTLHLSPLSKPNLVVVIPTYNKYILLFMPRRVVNASPQSRRVNVWRNSCLAWGWGASLTWLTDSCSCQQKNKNLQWLECAKTSNLISVWRARCSLAWASTGTNTSQHNSATSATQLMNVSTQLMNEYVTTKRRENGWYQHNSATSHEFWMLVQCWPCSASLNCSSERVSRFHCATFYRHETNQTLFWYFFHGYFW